jgi:hypothetical protein
LDKGKFELFLPELPNRIPILGILSTLAFLLFSASVVFLIFDPPGWLADLLEPTPAPAQVRPKVEVITLDTDSILIGQQGDFQYYFQNSEIRQIFEQAKQYFMEYRDNLAIVEVNRLLASQRITPGQRKSIADEKPRCDTDLFRF